MTPDDPTGETPTTPPPPRDLPPPAEVAPSAPSPTPPATPAPPAAPGKAGFLVRWRRRLIVGAFVGLLLVILGPWLLSHTVLAALIRPALGQGTQKGGLGGVKLGWNDGMELERLLVPSPREGAAPWVLLDDVRFEVGLVRAGFAAMFGGTVPLKLFVGPTRITFDQGDVAPAGSATTAATETGTEAKPEPESKPAEPGKEVLPCAVQPELEVERMDFVLRLIPDPQRSPLRVELRGLTAKGRLGIDRRLGVEMLPAGDGPATLSCSLEELRVEAERPEVLTAPIVFTRPRVVLSALSLPADDVANPVPVMQRLVLDVRFEVDALTCEGTEMREASFAITIKGGQCNVSMKARTEGGTFEALSSTDLHPTLRRPTSLEMKLGDVQVSGGLARAAPYILPILHATHARTAAGGKPGLPPLSFGAKGTIDIVSSAEGAFLLADTLDTLAIPDGHLRIHPGSLAASRALDGYARALAGLGVAGLLQGVLPAGLKFDGAEGKFTFKDGRCRFPALDLASKGTGVRLSADVAVAGDYELTMRSLLPADVQRTPVSALLRALDEAGGIKLRGNLTTDAVEPVLPDKEALERAAKSLGVDDLLQGLKLGGSAGSALDGLRGLAPR